MAAVAKREPSGDEFVGQVFRRASPILTWRPAVITGGHRESTTTREPSKRGKAESSVRFSKMPTRKIVAWPVLPKVVRDTRTDGTWSKAARASLVAAGLIVAAVVLAVVAAPRLSGHSGVASLASLPVLPGAAAPRSALPPVKLPASRVIDVGIDTLVPASLAPASPAPSAPAVIESRDASPRAPAGHRGRAHHGHRRAQVTHR